MAKVMIGNLKTENELRNDFKSQLVNKATYRSIAARYDNITCMDVYRIVQTNEFPRSDAKREALGLPCLTPVPICPIHGEAHTVSCPSQRKKRKPPPAMTESVRQQFGYDMLCLTNLTEQQMEEVCKIIKHRGYRLVRRKGEFQ